MNAKYDDILPSTNVTYDLAENIKLRASASRTMTRAATPACCCRARRSGSA